MLPYLQTDEGKLMSDYCPRKRCVMFTIIGDDRVIIVAAMSARVTVYELN